MSKLEKLDLMGVVSLGAVAAGLLVAWMVTTHNAAVQDVRSAGAKPVTLDREGRMRLTVTAGREDAGSAGSAMVRTASVRPSGGPSLEVALPFAFRP